MLIPKFKRKEFLRSVRIWMLLRGGWPMRVIVSEIEISAQVSREYVQVEMPDILLASRLVVPSY
jgi:hypothetical protein